MIEEELADIAIKFMDCGTYTKSDALATIEAEAKYNQEHKSKHGNKY